MVDYTKIKELIFKLLKERYPKSFNRYHIDYGDIHLNLGKEGCANWDEIPFTEGKTPTTPYIGVYMHDWCDCMYISLTETEFLKLQLLLRDVYPNWVQWRADDVEKSLTNLVSPSNFDQAQEQVLND